MAGSSQKFIARNRAPRVQIEYDVELYGAEKKVQLPFVMGVMSDLAGKSEVEQPAVADRKFLEIDVDNFDDRMKSIAPRAAFTVPNTLTGEGNMAIDLTFEKMSDFEPGAIAARVDSLRPLLEARQELSNLMTYMDGKAGAEALLEKVLGDRALLGALAASPNQQSDEQAQALDALRSVETVDAPEETGTAALDSLRAVDLPEVPEENSSDDALDALRAVEIEETPTDDSGAALDALRAVTVEDAPEEENSGAALDALKAMNVPAAETTEDATQALDALRAVEIVEDVNTDTSEALDALRAAEVIEPEQEPDNTAALDALRTAEVPEAEATDTSADILAAMPSVEAPQEDEVQADAILAGIDAVEVAEEEDTSAAVLAGIEEVEDAPVEDTSAAVLAGIEAVEELEPEDVADDVLAGIEAVEEEAQTDDVADALAGLEAPEEIEEGETSDDILAGIDAVEVAEEEDTSAAVLAGIEEVEDAPVEDTSAAVLASVEAVEEPEPEDAADDVLAGIEAVADATDDDDLADTLASLEVPPEVEEPEAAEDILAALDPIEDAPTDSTLDDALAGLEAPATVEEVDDTADILADLELPDAPVPSPDSHDDLDALLDDIGGDDPVVPAEAELGDLLADLASDPIDTEDDLEGLLSDLDAEEPQPSETANAMPEPTETPIPEDADLDDLMADLEPEETAGGDDLDALLGDLTTADDDVDLDDLLADLEPEAAPATPVDDQALDDLIGEPEAPKQAGYSDDDLDNLLSGLEDGLDASLDGSENHAPMAETNDLDDLLAGLEADPEAGDALADNAPQEAEDDLDSLLAGLDNDDATAGAAGDDDLDALLGDLENSDLGPEAVVDAAAAEAPNETIEAVMSEEPELAYGTMSGDRPAAQKLERRRFRIAILGDFTGRSAHGQIEVGDALAARKAIQLDPDTVEDVIESFATTLVLPIGKDGAGVEVKLGGLDDLHPDELYENVELFSALKGLKAQLGNGGTADNAAKSLVAWGEQHGRAVAPARAVSGGNTVRADLKLSDFQKLIGDTERTLAQPSPVDELMARVVGPHIRKLPDPNVTAMGEAVDEALSGAMRMVLHHPEFQSVESQWRALDLIARSIEVDDTLEVMLYDVSAEEIAADLTQSDDLSTSGLARLLTEEPMDEEFGRGGYSAIMGMYTFEETPPHAQLLGRIARVAAHVDAPFFAAITPGFIETAKQDRHPLVASEWDTLRAMPEAGHLALATPRFLMRRPYGAKTEPIYEFDFEEFTQSAGLSGMLWANPVVLVAILLARSFKENGPSMGLGQIMSLGDMPYHFVLDRYGDQVALPCTERNLTLDKVETVLGRGYLAVVSIKGRDEIRLASFQSLAGGEILGPWSGVAPPPPSPPKPPQAAPAASGTDDESAATDDDDLDDLLSGFDLDADDSEEDIDNDEDMDAELAALLADL